MSEVYSASAGGIQVLHTLATSDTAMTAAEITQWLDGANRDTVESTLQKLYQRGYIVREKRDTGAAHQHPWEYVVYQPDGDNE